MPGASDAADADDADPLPALVVVDLQAGFDDPSWGRRNNPDAESSARRLLAAWRGRGDVYHVRHDSTEPDSPLRGDRPGFAFAEGLGPGGDGVEVGKSVNSGLVGTDLERRLREAGHDRLVVAGLTTEPLRLHHGPDGREPRVRRDRGLGRHREYDGETFDPGTVHRTALAHLAGEFAAVATTTEVLAELGAPDPARASKAD